jgi:aryl-alcohol dehydrogenase (NADP+)
MTFGFQCEEATATAILDKAADSGVTFLDTADVYPLGGGLESVGRTEEILGRWLHGRRHEFVVATKGCGRTGPRDWDRGNSRRHILDAVDASLRRLGTDWIDLYQLHDPDPETPIDETLEALTAVVRAGKVRYVGCCNFLAYQVARAMGRSEAANLVKFISVQPRYNLVFRQYERELFPLCLEEGIAVLPYNPLAGGVLSGKHNWNNAPAEGTRFALGTAGNVYRDRYWHEHIFKTADEIAVLAKQAGVPMASMAVAWVLQHPAVTAPIVGASHPDQLEETLVAASLKLDPDLLSGLDELTRGYRLGDARR